MPLFKQIVSVRRKMLKTLFPLIIVSLFLISGCALAGQYEENSRSPEEYREIGDQYFNEGELQTALDYYLTASGKEPENPLYYYKIGLVYGTLASLEGYDRSLKRGKTNQLSRKLYREDSHFNNALYYFNKAAGLGHLPSREIIRTMDENIQHRDVKY
jgi:tetratricopeptide (TPR) repeat protein